MVCFIARKGYKRKSLFGEVVFYQQQHMLADKNVRYWAVKFMGSWSLTRGAA
jgi:hypothetical protein